MALLALHISYLPHFIPAGGANECWAVLRMRDRCPLVINPCTYPLTCQFSKFSNKRFWCIIMVLKLFKRSKNWPKNHQFFAGSFMKTIHSLRFFWNNCNGQFFDSEYFSKNWNCRLFDSEILKNQTDDSFKTSKNCPTLLPRACWLDLPLCFSTHTHTHTTPKIK